MTGRISHLRCTECLKPFESLDSIIQCSGKCGSVFHVLCIDLKDNERKALFGSDRLCWLCDRCYNVDLKSVNVLLLKLVATIAELSSDIKELKAIGIAKPNAGCDCIVNSTASPENFKTGPTATKTEKNFPESEDTIDLFGCIKNRKSSPDSEDNIALCDSVKNDLKIKEQCSKAAVTSECNSTAHSIENDKVGDDVGDSQVIKINEQSSEPTGTSECNSSVCPIEIDKVGDDDGESQDLKIKEQCPKPAGASECNSSVCSSENDKVEDDDEESQDLKFKEQSSKTTLTSECNSRVLSIENYKVGDDDEESQDMLSYNEVLFNSKHPSIKELKIIPRSSVTQWVNSFAEYGGIELRVPENGSLSIADEDPGEEPSMVFEMGTLSESKEFPLSLIEEEDTHVEPSVLRTPNLSPGQPLAGKFSKVFPRRRKLVRRSPLYIGSESENSCKEKDISQDGSEKENKHPTASRLEDSSLNESLPSSITLDDCDPEEIANHINTSIPVPSLAKSLSSPTNNERLSANVPPTPQPSTPAPVRNKSTPAKSQPSSAKKRSLTSSPQPSTSGISPVVRRKEVAVRSQIYRSSDDSDDECYNVYIPVEHPTKKSSARKKPKISNNTESRLSVRGTSDNTDACVRRTRRNVVKYYKEPPLNKYMRSSYYF